MSAFISSRISVGKLIDSIAKCSLLSGSVATSSESASTTASLSSIVVAFLNVLMCSVVMPAMFSSFSTDDSAFSTVVFSAFVCWLLKSVSNELLVLFCVCCNVFSASLSCCMSCFSVIKNGNKWWFLFFYVVKNVLSFFCCFAVFSSLLSLIIRVMSSPNLFFKSVVA